jgi:hypothetical protein
MARISARRNTTTSKEYTVETVDDENIMRRAWQVEAIT